MAGEPVKFGVSKSEGIKNLDRIEEGGAASTGGPTSSSRSYPKGGKPGDTQDADFNPQKVRATDLYVGGV